MIQRGMIQTSAPKKKTVAKKKAAAKKKPVRKPRVEKFCQQLKCELTIEEKLQVAETLADMQREIERLESEKKEFTTSIKAKIETAKAQAMEAGEQFRTGHEFRRVDCTRMFNWKTGTVIEIRKDTNETLVNRKMTNEEDQVKLDLGDQK